MDTVVAAISTATAGVSENPGRCAVSRPAAAPRNRPGKVGPPQKLPSEMLQARPLNRSCGAWPLGSRHLRHDRFPERVRGAGASS